MRQSKSASYDEINLIPEVREEEIPRLRSAYATAHGKACELDDDDLVNIMGGIDDDQDDETWAKVIKAYEDLTPGTPGWEDKVGYDRSGLAA